MQGKALRHQWLELGTQTGLAMAMLAATQMHRFGCGSACQLGNGALVAENDPSASGHRGLVALHHVARGIRAVQADLKLPPGSLNGPDLTPLVFLTAFTAWITAPRPVIHIIVLLTLCPHHGLQACSCCQTAT